MTGPGGGGTHTSASPSSGTHHEERRPVVGAIGTSGETPEEDEAVSLAGAAAGFSVSESKVITRDGAALAVRAIGAEAAARGVAPVVCAVDDGGELITCTAPTAPRRRAST